MAEHRAAVARRLGCDPAELTFTSCGTEGDNWAVRAAAEHGRRRGRPIITTAIEHAAVLEPVKALAAQGYEGTYLKPDRAGRVSVDELRAALREEPYIPAEGEGAPQEAGSARQGSVDAQSCSEEGLADAQSCSEEGSTDPQSCSEEGPADPKAEDTAPADPKAEGADRD